MGYTEYINESKVILGRQSAGLLRLMPSTLYYKEEREADNNQKMKIFIKRKETIMRRIIDGKMYNTDTATLVGEYSYGYMGQHEYWSEELYIKKTGEWFLYGCGGALSKYSEDCGNRTICGSEEIIPYTPDEAKEWLMQYNYVNKYIKYFGEPEE